jgi:CheY-like chemotaxis protein
MGPRQHPLAAIGLTMPKTILLADDSSTIRKIVELTFNGTDIRVETFASGTAALENLERVAPDLILADVVMPGPTGYELCRQVKASANAIPVVLLSSTFEPYDSDLAAECGADRHLVKPFESGTLTDAVRELLESSAPVVTAEDDSEFSEVDDAVEELIDDTAEDRQEDPADGLDERLVEAVSKAVVRRLSEQVVREIAREVVPDLAERIIRERIRQLESEDS